MSLHAPILFVNEMKDGFGSVCGPALKQQATQGSVSVAHGTKKGHQFWSRDQYFPGAQLLCGAGPTGESACLGELGRRAKFTGQESRWTRSRKKGSTKKMIWTSWLVKESLMLSKEVLGLEGQMSEEKEC